MSVHLSLRLTPKISLRKNKTEKLRSKISKSLSPNKIKLSDQFDLSVMKQARMRIERSDEGANDIQDQMSPKQISPSCAKAKKKKSLVIGIIYFFNNRYRK